MNKIVWFDNTRASVVLPEEVMNENWWWSGANSILGLGLSRDVVKGKSMTNKKGKKQKPLLRVWKLLWIDTGEQGEYEVWRLNENSQTIQNF